MTHLESSNVRAGSKCDPAAQYTGFDNKFHITYWYGPPAEFTSVPVYRQIREAGFDLAGAMGAGGSTVEQNLKFLDACLANGMKGIVIDQRTGAMFEGRDGWESLAEEMVNTYRSHPALWGYYLYDEPNAGCFEALGRVVRKLKELDPDHIAYINLFPNYASNEMLGTPDYRTYLRRYLETVKPAFLSYDHYHFLNVPDPDAKPVDEAEAAGAVESSGDRREDMIRQSAMINVERAGFFDNLEAARDLCNEFNVPLMVIVLLIQHGPYRYLRESELRFEAFQSLCYGASYLSYFTYWTVIDSPDSWWQWREAMVDTGGCILQHYYDVQRVNRDLQVYGDLLLGRRLERVTHYGSETESVSPFSPDALVLSISGDVRLTVSEFSGGYVALANKDFDRPAEFNVTLAKKTALIRSSDGKPALTGDNNFSVSLAPGDMVLLATEF